MELAIEWWAQFLHVQEDLQGAGLEIGKRFSMTRRVVP